MLQLGHGVGTHTHTHTACDRQHMHGPSMGGEAGFFDGPRLEARRKHDLLTNPSIAISCNSLCVFFSWFSMLSDYENLRFRRSVILEICDFPSAKAQTCWPIADAGAAWKFGLGAGVWATSWTARLSASYADGTEAITSPLRHFQGGGSHWNFFETGGA